MSEPRTRLLPGGMRTPERGHMPTLFSLIIMWALLWMLGLVLIPYAVTRLIDSPWSDPRQILLRSFAVGFSIAFGVMGYLTLNRKGLSDILGFVIAGGMALMGTAMPLIWLGDNSLFVRLAVIIPLAPLGLVAIWLATLHRPDAPPAPVDPVFKYVDRTLFAMGNIWFGISQLMLILVVLVRATVYESQTGSSEAAYASFYNADWFGVVFLVFFVTLYCATLRKFPFRTSQLGWLCVHAGLLILLVGCMAMFWGSFMGNVQILEGQTKSKAFYSDKRELHVWIDGLEYKEQFLVSADRNPMESRVQQQIPVSIAHEGRTHEYEFEIDRYYVKGKAFRRLAEVDHDHEGADQHNHEPGAQIRISAPGFSNEYILLSETDPQVDLSLFQVIMVQVPHRRFREALSFRREEGDRTRGNIRVLGANGLELTRTEIVVADRPTQAGFAVETEPLALPGEVTVSPKQFYGGMRGIGYTPILEVTIAGPKGPVQYMAFGDGRTRPMGSAPDLYPEFQIVYDCLPQITPARNAMVMAIGPGGERAMGIVDGSGAVRVEDLEVGRTYRLSDSARIKITVMELADAARIVTGFEPSDDEDARRAIHVKVRKKGSSESESAWLRQFGPTATLTIGDQRIDVAYRARERDLGFELSVVDFRQFRYANSTKPRAFETNVVLRDKELGVEESVLIDMNHPLSYGGYRFFNQNPIEERDWNKRGIVFQVARNPGRPVIYGGAFIVFVGLVTVFFFKTYLRRWEKRRRESRVALAAGQGA